MLLSWRSAPGVPETGNIPKLPLLGPRACRSDSFPANAERGACNLRRAGASESPQVLANRPGIQVLPRPLRILSVLLHLVRAVRVPESQAIGSDDSAAVGPVHPATA